MAICSVVTETERQYGMSFTESIVIKSEYSTVEWEEIA
jgi:hypothetical protein